jgi:hypothetical protein
VRAFLPAHPHLSHLSHRDYAQNELLDRYSDTGINDDEDIDELTPDGRRAAERHMARRDRQERTGKRGSRAARRSRMPAFLGSDADLDEDEEMDDVLGISRMKRRTRRQYDERRDLDDLDGVEDVSRCLVFCPANHTQLVFRNFRLNNLVISKRSPSWSGLRMNASGAR